MSDVAHGLGGGGDLPIPAVHVMAGATGALVVSFAVLLLAWRTPHYSDHRAPRPVPSWLSRLADEPILWLLSRTFGATFMGFGMWCVVAGPDDVSTNPVFGMVYVLLWVGLVPASILLGPVVRAVSPSRTIHAGVCLILRRDRHGLFPVPSWLGLYPAAIGLLAFVWLELVSPDGTALRAVAAWFAVYVVVMVGGALCFGEQWFESADPFEVYSTLVSHLSVWTRRPDGQLAVVSPLRHLAALPATPGLLAVTGVLLGSTAFDSFRESTGWVRFTQDNPQQVVALETLLLCAVCAGVVILFAAAVTLSKPRAGVERLMVPGLMAHSLLPIIIGYLVAHYLTLLVETGQATIIRMSDPLDRGMNLFGTADRQVDLFLSFHPSLLATVKVVAIVTGHVVGVIAAHDRSLQLLPVTRHASGQVPLLLVMVAFTFGGLYLIFGL